MNDELFPNQFCNGYSSQHNLLVMTEKSKNQ